MTIQRTDQTPGRESDEEYLRGVMATAMSGTRPPLDLGGAALAEGRRLRTRHRAVVAVVGAAASVLAALSVPWVVGGDDTARRSSSDLVATEPPAPAPEARRGWWDMPATGMVDAIEAILPDGVVVTSPGPLEADTPEGGPAHGWINAHLEAATGPGRLNVMLYPAPADGEGTPPDTDLSCDEELAGHTTCRQLRDETGTVVGRRLTSRWGGTVMREVVLRRDGGTVYAAAANTLDDKWGADSPLSADEPPLTLDQLEDLVRNDVWVSYRP